MYNYEQQIEDGLVTELTQGNTAFEVNTFYEAGSFETVAEFLLAKVKAKPAIFLRCTGLQTQSINTFGDLYNASYNVEIICSANSMGRNRQLKGEQRKVNALCLAVLARLNGFRLDLDNQPLQPVLLQSIADMFVTDGLDARQMNFTVDGIVLDLTSNGLDQNLDALL